MSNLDHNRATFVQNEYRYSRSFDAATKAIHQKSESLTIDTNLEQSVADALSIALLNELKNPAKAFEIEIQGIVSLDIFAGSVPRYTLIADQYKTDSQRIFKLAGCEIDYEANTTLLRIRG